MGERGVRNAEVRGSIPLISTNLRAFGLAFCELKGLSILLDQADANDFVDYL